MLSGLPRVVKIVIAIGVGIPLVGLAAAYVSGSLLAARVSGNEASAIGSLRVILSGQVTFAATQCVGLYAPDLVTLASGGFISADLAGATAVEKAGYRITLTPGKADPSASGPATPACRGAVSTFTATAVPVVPGQTGIRFFITDQESTVKQATSAAFADATPVK